MKEFWAKYKMAMSIVAVSLTVAVSWVALDLPRPATYSELKAVELRVASNEQLIYGDRWVRLTAQIKALEAALTKDPSNRSIIQELAVKQGLLRVVNKNLDN